MTVRLDDPTFETSAQGFVLTRRDKINQLLDILENYAWQYPGPGDIVDKIRALVEN